jgi:hypothetical protein
VGIEPTIPVFERAKTFHALDRAATLIALLQHTASKIYTVTLLYRFHLPRHQMRMSGQFHTPAALPPAATETGQEPQPV